MKRPEFARLAIVALLAREPLHRIDLVVERPAAIDDDMVLARAGLQRNAVGAAREQVHGRRAVQREVFRADGRLERRIVAIEQHGQFERVAGRACERGAQPMLKNRKRAGNAKYSRSSR